jgi:hypothetical protein
MELALECLSFFINHFPNSSSTAAKLNYYRLKAVGLNIGLKPSKREKKPKTLKDWPSASIIII